MNLILFQFCFSGYKKIVIFFSVRLEMSLHNQFGSKFSKFLVIIFISLNEWPLNIFYNIYKHKQRVIRRDATRCYFGIRHKLPEETF